MLYWFTSVNTADNEVMVVDKYGRKYEVIALENLNKFTILGHPVSTVLRPIQKTSSKEKPQNTTAQASPAFQLSQRSSGQGSPTAMQKPIKDHMLMGELALQLVEDTKGDTILYQSQNGNLFQLCNYATFIRSRSKWLHRQSRSTST